MYPHKESWATLHVSLEPQLNRAEHYLFTILGALTGQNVLSDKIDGRDSPRAPAHLCPLSPPTMTRQLLVRTSSTARRSFPQIVRWRTQAYPLYSRRRQQSRFTEDERDRSPRPAYSELQLETRSRGTMYGHPGTSEPSSRTIMRVK